MDKVDIVRDLFLDFNRDPFKNKSLVEHYVNKFWDCKEGFLKKACEELSLQSDTLPRWKHIFAKYKEIEALNDNSGEYVRVDCDDCGGSGVIKSVFFGNIEIFSLNFHGDGATYYDTIIGKCHCVAGERMPEHMPVKFPPKFIKDYARELGFDCCYTASKIVTKKMKEMNESCSISESTQESTEDVQC